jgi:hypothetical protein
MISGVLLEQEKKCSRCAEVLPFTDFAKDAQKPHGLRSACKKCELGRHSEYYSRSRVTMDGILRSMLADAKKRARKKGVPFSLTLEHLYSLVVHRCPITLSPIDWTKAEVVKGPGDNSPSLDKIVPELGYVEGNCAIISFRGNLIKSNGTIDEHRRIIRYMAEQQIKHIVF